MSRGLETMVRKHMEINREGMGTLNQRVLFAAPKLWMNMSFAAASGGNSTHSKISKHIITAAM